MRIANRTRIALCLIGATLLVPRAAFGLRLLEDILDNKQIDYGRLEQKWGYLQHAIVRLNLDEKHWEGGDSAAIYEQNDLATWKFEEKRLLAFFLFVHFQFTEREVSAIGAMLGQDTKLIAAQLESLNDADLAKALARGANSTYTSAVTKNFRRSVAFLKKLAPQRVNKKAGQEGAEFSVDETLRNAAFNTQRMPPEKLLVSRYGKGKTYRRAGRVYHVYYLSGPGLWLRCRGDTEDRIYTPISEVMISKLDLGTAIRAKTEVTDPNLKGIRIGDDIKKATDQWGEPLRMYPESIGGLKTKVYEFFPDSVGPGSCLRFFERSGTIVAFSFSSEE